jgi:hypothetical protein
MKCLAVIRNTTSTSGAEEIAMAKSQKHGNREAKKPKKVKASPSPVATEGLLTRAGSGPGSGAGKKRG